MSNIEKWEQQALSNHKRIERAFWAGKSGIKKAGLEDGSIQLRIANHLLETGGGLTADEILRDARATEGKEWRNISNDGTPLDIYAVLAHMVAPGSAMKRILESAGGFGIMDYSLAEKMDEQNVLTFEDGQYYLWCQDGIDWGARLSVAKSKLEAAQKKADSIESLKGKISSHQEKLDELKKERSALGFFKFSEKKSLKKRIANEEKKLGSCKIELSSAEKARASLSQLTKDYEEACAVCKKALVG